MTLPDTLARLRAMADRREATMTDLLCQGKMTEREYLRSLAVMQRNVQAQIDNTIWIEQVKEAGR